MRGSEERGRKGEREGEGKGSDWTEKKTGKQEGMRAENRGGIDSKN